MKIGIDAFGLQLDGGVRTYILNLITGLEGSRHDVTVYYASKGDKIGLEHKEVVVGPKRKLLVPFRDNTTLLNQVRGSDLDVFHVTRSTGPISGFGKTTVLRTVHDLCWKYSREQRADRLSKLYKRLVQELVFERSDGVICPSESTKRQVTDVYGLDESDLHVTPLGVGGEFQPLPIEETRQTRTKYEIKRPSILTVGVISPRKNILRLTEEFAESSISDTHTLLIAGSTGPGGDRVISEIRNRFASENIQLLGHVSKSDLIDLYNISTLFVFISHCEGFGLPPLEAMACGTPVIVSNTSSLPEVVGDAGVLVDPKDQTALAREMTRLLRDDDLLETMENRAIGRASQFSWNRTVRETVQAYQQSRQI